MTAAFRFARATYCSPRIQSLATIGHCSANNHGGACTDQATVVPFRPTEPGLAAAGPGSRKAQAATKTGAGL